MAQPHLIDGIKRVKNSFNSYTLDTLAQVGMTQSILDHRYKTQTCEHVIKTRNMIKKELIEMGFEVLDSKSNFLFVTHNKYKAKEIFNYLKLNNILVRHFENPKRIENYLRISIGTDKEMDILIKKLWNFSK
jgi:histidinol-phosphate aminotransferase